MRYEVVFRIFANHKSGYIKIYKYHDIPTLLMAIRSKSVVTRTSANKQPSSHEITLLVISYSEGGFLFLDSHVPKKRTLEYLTE